MDCAFGAVCVQLTKAAAQPSAHLITALVVFPVTLLTLLLLRRSSHKAQAILQCYRLGRRTTEPAVNCILLMPSPPCAGTNKPELRRRSPASRNRTEPIHAFRCGRSTGSRTVSSEELAGSIWSFSAPSGIRR